LLVEGRYQEGIESDPYADKIFKPSEVANFLEKNEL